MAQGLDDEGYLGLHSQQAPITRTGVFVCDCGGKISAYLDTTDLCKQISALPEVVFACKEAFPCSQSGRQRMQVAIRDHQLDRVLVAGCTPRLVEKTFQNTLQAAGLSPANLEITDIREQCAFIHQADPQGAYEKACTMVEASLARLASASPTMRQEFPLVKAVTIFGASLAGLTVAIDLAQAGMHVCLVDPADRPVIQLLYGNDSSAELFTAQLEAACELPMITFYLGARLLNISGRPGNYQIEITRNGQTISLTSGALILAADPQPTHLNPSYWYDRMRVRTIYEFQNELQNGYIPDDVVFCLDSKSRLEEQDSSLFSLEVIRQAIQVKKLNPENNVTILFRNLSLGKDEGLARKAADLGVTFFRYPENHPPQINEKTINLFDPLTNSNLQIPYHRLVLTTTLVLDENTQKIAAMLHLPRDKQGFLIEPHLRLRPGRYIDNGIFILAGTHQPVALQDTLFQAHMASTRVQHYLEKQYLHTTAPVAEIDKELCTGCGECVQVCLMHAIHLEKRDNILSISQVDPLLCTGCGNCAVACPVKAISIPGFEDEAILAQITTALQPRSFTSSSLPQDSNLPEAKILVFACEWSAYAAADMAGVKRLPYPANTYILRMNCSARFDPHHILWAFLNGAAGVILGVCPIGECHYGTGNLFAQQRADTLKKQLAEHGINPNRLSLMYIRGDDGEGFATEIHQFISQLNPHPIRHSTGGLR